MHSKTPLLPLYETSEEHLGEAQASCSPSDSYCSTLSAVVVDYKDDSSPLIESPPAADKKHVKFINDLGEIYRPEPWSGETPCNKHNSRDSSPRASYGSISYHSILKKPSKFWSQKVGKEKGHLNGSECRTLRTRIRLRAGFSPAEISDRQKLSPLVCLLGSFTVMVLIFLWFLNGGDNHSHENGDFEATSNQI